MEEKNKYTWQKEASSCIHTTGVSLPFSVKAGEVKHLWHSELSQVYTHFELTVLEGEVLVITEYPHRFEETKKEVFLKDIASGKVFEYAKSLESITTVPAGQSFIGVAGSDLFLYAPKDSIVIITLNPGVISK